MKMIVLREIYKPISLLLVVLTALCGCGNLYTGDETPVNAGTDDSDDNPFIYEEELPVMVAFSDPSYTVLTRGQGALDPNDTENYPTKKANATFHIYAFRSDNPSGMTYETTRAQDTDRVICLVDGSTGKQGNDAEWSKHGRQACYNPASGSFISWKDEDDPLYYSTLSQISPFNFFAYYVDDLCEGQNNYIGEKGISNFVRGVDDIRFKVSVDGSQDLMCAVASLTQDQKDNYIARLSAEEQEKVYKYYYSTYTAHRNIHPVLQLKHQLANVKFAILPTKLKNDITIESIAIKTVNKGTFIVAARDITQVGAHFSEDDEQKELPLREADNTAFVPRLVVAGGEKVELDNSLLVPPTNNASLIIKASVDKNGQKYYYTTVYPLKDIVKNTKDGETLEPGFLAGWRYTISISVYGPEEIQVQVEIDGWEDGGNIELDPDDFFE